MPCGAAPLDPVPLSPVPWRPRPPTFFFPEGKQKTPRSARSPLGYVSIPARPVPRRGMRALRCGGAPHAGGESARRCSERSGTALPARPRPRTRQVRPPCAARVAAPPGGRTERRPRERRQREPHPAGPRSGRNGQPAARQPAMSQPGNRSSLRTGLRRACRAMLGDIVFLPVTQTAAFLGAPPPVAILLDSRRSSGQRTRCVRSENRGPSHRWVS